MFLENSRYVKVPTVEATTADGRKTTAVKLRPLAATAGEPHTIKDNDQLDVLAQQQYADGTKFWHIADANTALDATALVRVAGDTLLKPRQ